MTSRILVVDDEPDLEILIRQRFRHKIRDGAYDFLFAANGVQALEKLDQEADIDVVLTDLNMPEMDGLTLLGELAAREELLKSVVVSAYDDMTNIRTAMNRGAFDFITKPIDFQDLEVTLEKTLREVANLREGVKAREHLAVVRHELEVAGGIQRAILPEEPPKELDRFGVELCARMTPAREIGGDYYDYFMLSPNRLGLVVADVAGKGVPAALLMAVVRSLLKATAVTGIEPAQVLGQVNRLLCGENVNDVFVTAFYGVLELESGEFRFSNAGHNPPFRVSPGEMPQPLENQGGLVLGVEPESAYETGHLVLGPGDVLFIYTDGVTEAMDEAHGLFGEDRLAESLRESSTLSLEALFGEVETSLASFVQDAPQHDDITMLAIRKRPAAEEA